MQLARKSPVGVIREYSCVTTRDGRTRTLQDRLSDTLKRYHQYWNGQIILGYQQWVKYFIIYILKVQYRIQNYDFEAKFNIYVSAMW